MSAPINYTMASPPAWSMGGSKRSDFKSRGVPGPGSYNSTLNDKRSNPSWRLGTAGRNNELRNEVPGPGSYNSPGKISTSNPQYGFGARTAVDFKDFTPGPGAYNSAGSRGFDNRAPSYSFQTKAGYNSQSQVQVPGPGTYNYKLGDQNGPSYRIGSSKRNDMYNSALTPGPGTYTTRPSSAYGEGPKYGFGSTGRDSVGGNNKNAPGPGAYTYKGSFEQMGKGTTITGKRPDSALFGGSRSPGPGAYNPAYSTKTAPSYRLGSATRATNERSDSPGPGNYDPRLMRGNQNVKIGTSTRKGMYEDKTTPGPGTYNYGSKVGEGPKFVMNPRRDEYSSTMKFMPGPGAYSPKHELTKFSNSATRIGTSTRYDMSPNKNNVGPGQYDVRGKFGGPKYGFGSSARGQEVKSNAPGPGQYKLPHSVGDVATYAYHSSTLKIHL